MTYARYSPITPIETTAKNATGTPAALPDSAKNVREQLVTHAMPQKNCPIAEIRITTSAQPSDIALWKIASVVPPPSFTAPTSLAAKVIARSTNQPISPESATDCQTPLAADTSASRVSSATCADAS